MRIKSLVFAASLGACAAVTLLPEVAHAQDPNMAEKLRLEEEMKKLAAKNAWAGVERNYDALLKLGVEVTFDDHFLGAQAAKYQGKTYEMYTRLTAAKEKNAKEEIVTELDAIDAQYGRVEIKGTLKILPTVDVVMPFSPDQRKSIEWAQKVLSETGSFKGMLPIDIEYGIVGPTVVKFTPKAGPDWIVLDLSSAKKYKELGSGAPPVPEVVVTPPVDGTKPPVDGAKPPKTPKPASGATQGNIDTAGPIAMIGYNFMSSGVPAEPSAQTLDTLQPDSISGSGLSAEVGAEVVFTGKLIAVSGTVAYSGMYGTDSYNGFRGWLAASVRPGNLRVTAGPTYGVIEGHGVGVAPWLDVGQDQQVFPAEQLEFVGRSLAAGVQFTAGYGLLDFGSLMGTVEIGGAWQYDGVRSYVGGGLRIGVVPAIERFKG